jgi:uncharacterized protein (TIGR02453 family)
MQTSTIQYLKKLRKNNTREWFEANRNLYDTARADFTAFVDETITACGKIDPALAALNAKDCIFRIYRDVRFSHDKTPYKTSFSAQLKAGGKKSANCGLYIHIEPDGKEGSFLAGGFWMPEAPLLKAIRQEIEYNTDEFKSILANPKFKKTFGGLEPHKLTRVPKGIDKDHPDAELLKHVSFIVSREITIDEITGNNLPKTIARDYLIMKPFLDFLNRALH